MKGGNPVYAKGKPMSDILLKWLFANILSESKTPRRQQANFKTPYEYLIVEVSVIPHSPTKFN